MFLLVGGDGGGGGGGGSSTGDCGYNSPLNKGLSFQTVKAPWLEYCPMEYSRPYIGITPTNSLTRIGDVAET